MRLGDYLLIFGLLAVLVAASLTAPRWGRFLRRSTAIGPVAEATPPQRAPRGERRIQVQLFFEHPELEGLVAENRSVALTPDLGGQVKRVVQELLRGSDSELISPLPEGTRVLDVLVTDQGVAIVDLSREASEGHLGGSGAELLSVYAVVNSVTTNFPAIRRVQLLIDDRTADTLAGHVDLSRPLAPDMTLLAPAEFEDPDAERDEDAGPAGGDGAEARGSSA